MAMVTDVFKCPIVHVHQIPPPTGKGLRTTQLRQPAMFTGSLRLMQTLSPLSLEIRIEAPAAPLDNSANSPLPQAPPGELFAACPYSHANAVERSIDSGRVFQLRVVHERRVAYLAIAFLERDPAFDFQVALADFEKLGRAETLAAAAAETGPDAEEKTTLAKLQAKPVETFAEAGVIPLLAPPPPPSAPAATTQDMSAADGFDDDFGDFQ